MGDKLPASERQARALAACADNDETRAHVWSAVVAESAFPSRRQSGKLKTRRLIVFFDRESLCESCSGAGNASLASSHCSWRACLLLGG